MSATATLRRCFAEAATRSGSLRSARPVAVYARNPHPPCSSRVPGRGHTAWSADTDVGKMTRKSKLGEMDLVGDEVVGGSGPIAPEPVCATVWLEGDYCQPGGSADPSQLRPLARAHGAGSAVWIELGLRDPTPVARGWFEGSLDVWELVDARVIES